MRNRNAKHEHNFDALTNSVFSIKVYDIEKKIIIRVHFHDGSNNIDPILSTRFDPYHNQRGVKFYGDDLNNYN